MKIGADGKKIPNAQDLGPIGVLEAAHRMGMEGVFFRSILAMSPTLDDGELREIRQHANSLGLYLETGVGKVNPYSTVETPEVRRLGDGDYVRGLTRMIKASMSAGCRELWVSAADYQKSLSGIYVFDRFRTDAPWPDQLQAIERFLRRLAPVLRDLGCRLNIETHEEITTFEILRLIEAVGDDVLGVTLDLANVLVRGEDPVAATERVAPFVHNTHMKDAILYFVDHGLERQLRPCGEGIIDWPRVLKILAKHHPDLHLSIEAPAESLGHIPMHIYLGEWQEGHPDLTVGEFAEIVRLARCSEERIASGSIPSPYPLREHPLSDQEKEAFIVRSAAYLKDLVQSRGASVEASSRR